MCGTDCYQVNDLERSAHGMNGLRSVVFCGQFVILTEIHALLLTGLGAPRIIPYKMAMSPNLFCARAVVAQHREESRARKDMVLEGNRSG